MHILSGRVIMKLQIQKVVVVANAWLHEEFWNQRSLQYLLIHVLDYGKEVIDRKVLDCFGRYQTQNIYAPVPILYKQILYSYAL